jgi:hypothetical protein
MSFEALVTALWRNRVRVLIGAVIVVLVTFSLLVVFVTAFQVMVINLVMQLVQALFLFAIFFLALSFIWKSAVGNFKGSGGKKK